MQGGLLAGVIANQKVNKSSNLPDWLPVGGFLISKLVVHTVFGALLGGIGTVISLSLPVRLAFQIFTAVFMLATAMNLLNIHPIFRVMAFQPPKFAARWIRSGSKSAGLFAPVVLGALTVFVPCGVTQAMEILAINSANSLTGAGIMAAFVLGTTPVFATLGMATSKLTGRWKMTFSRVAAAVLIGMAIYGVNGVLIVQDSPYTLQRIYQTAFVIDQKTDTIARIPIGQDGRQKVTINIHNNGYEPKYIRVKSGIPVDLQLSTKDTFSCASAFTMRAFGISENLKPNESKTVTFNPEKKGKYTFTCSMGMYSGVLEVI